PALVSIALPKRQFRLKFRDLGRPVTPGRRFGGYKAALICVSLALPAVYWLGSLRHGGSAVELDPAVRLICAPFFDSPKPTVACLGTPLFLRNRAFRVRDSHLNATDTPEARARIQGLQEKLGLDSFVPTFDYTGIGEAYAAFDI